MNKKVLFIGGGAVAVIAIVVALIFVFLGGSDEYRSIKVFELDGTCTVTRGNDTLDAFKNMSLSSGDVFEVPGTGFARLKLDDDKYVYLEAGTKIELFATGTENDSKTRVFIERGSMMTEVKKKLSATSSYDIVTPNTTMSIRGTKTLTEVIEDVVTGHVKTSNAVLEGQVKIKAVKVKADGTVVSVEKDLGAGEGNAFSSAKEELVSQEEMKSIADTGASVSGITVEIVSEEEAEVVFDVATFEASFLENVKSILVADAEAAAGEGGLSQDRIDEINSQLGEIIEAFNEISENSQQAFNATADSGTVPEETPEIISEPATENDYNSSFVSEPVTDFTPVTNNENTQDEGTTLVDGETSLVVIDDADDGDDGADGQDDGADEVGAEDDDNSEDGEDEETGDDADDDAGDEVGDDAEEAEDAEEEEDAGEDEGEADEEEDAEEEGEKEEEPEEAAEEAAEEAPAEVVAPDVPAESGSSSSSASESSENASHTVSYSESTSWDFSDSSSSSGSDATEWTVSLRFIDMSSESEVSVDQLPKSAGSRLPGEDAPISVVVNVSENCPEIYGYEFTGWYTDPGFSESSRVDIIPSSLSDDIVLYPEIKQITKIRVEYKSLNATFTVNNVNTTVSLGVNAGNLPTLFNPGESLPGAPTVGVAEAFADGYEFVGWFTSATQAADPLNNEPITAVPQTSSSTIGLWAGIKIKRFTVTFTNLFTRAGQVYIPGDYTSGEPDSNGITYTYDTNGGGNRIIVSGIPYGYELPLPFSVDNYEDSSIITGDAKAQLARTRLFVKGDDSFHSETTSDIDWDEMISPTYLGVGSSDQLSLSEIAIEYSDDYDAYQANIIDTGKFYPGQYSNAESVENNKKVIKADCNLYLYFAIPVTLSVNVGEENLSKTQFTYTNGETQSLGDILDMNLQNNSVPVEFDDLVVLENGSKWNFEVGDGRIKATTCYYGKRLEIPQVSLSEMPAQKDLYRMLYTIKQKNAPDNEGEPVFRGVTYEDNMTLLGDAVDSTDPLPDLINGKVWYTKLRFNVILNDYVLLNMSESGIESLYTSSCNVIRDSDLETQSKIKLSVEYGSDRGGISLPVVFDSTEESVACWNNYPYEKDDDGNFVEFFKSSFLEDDYIYQAYNIPTGMRLSGKKVIGYRLDYTPKPTSDNTNPEPVTDGLMFGMDFTGYPFELYHTENAAMLLFEGEVIPVDNLVITPIFVYEKPFTVTVMRKGNTMTNTYSQGDWPLNDYVTVLEGPGLVAPNAIDDPFVTRIIKSTLNPVYTDSYGQETTESFSLIPVLTWNSSTRKYEKRVYDQSQGMSVAEKSYDVINGRIEIPWSDCFNEQGATNESGFYKGAKFNVEHNNDNIPPDECGVYFTTSVFLDYTTFRAKPEDAEMVGNEEEWQMFSCDLAQGTDAMFTAIWNGYETYSIINEKTDSFSTPEDFLRLASGENDLSEVRFGGKLYPMTGYSPSFESVLITRDTVGLSGSIIHGSGSFGSGELEFSPVNSIYVTNRDTAIVYPYNDYEFAEETIQRKAGVDTDTCDTLNNVDLYEEPFFIIKSEESKDLPEGWIVIDYRWQSSPESYYYVYIGENENVEGRAQVEYKTEKETQV